MPESFVNQATGRCSEEGSKFWFNCNPEGPYHWFKLNWIDKAKEKNLVYLHFTMDDNLSLSESIKKRYIQGLWSVAEGVIYDMFDSVKYMYNEIKSSFTKDCYVSIDYGTQNATVFLLWRKGLDGIWYCEKEYYYSGRDNKKQKTDKEFADDLEDFMKIIQLKK